MKSNPDFGNGDHNILFSKPFPRKLIMETILLTENLTVFLTVQTDQQSHSNSSFCVKPWEILINWQLEK